MEKVVGYGREGASFCTLELDTLRAHALARVGFLSVFKEGLRKAVTELPLASS